MSKAFVDTTILADCLLKPSPAGEPSRKALAQFSTTLLPCFAIKEFKSGAFAGFVYAHNVLLEADSLTGALDRVHRLSRTPKRYLTSTAIEALREAHYTSLGDDLVSKYSSLADPDSAQAAKYRLSLKRLIIRAWKKRRSLTSHVVVELSCYPETPPVIKDRGRIELFDKNCEPIADCVLAAQMKKNVRALQQLIAATESKEHLSEEDKRRVTALRLMVRHTHRNIDDKRCRHIGDAVFAFFCPADATILTTNIRDHRLLASAVGKSAVSPAEIVI